MEKIQVTLGIFQGVPFERVEVLVSLYIKQLDYELEISIA